MKLLKAALFFSAFVVGADIGLILLGLSNIGTFIAIALHLFLIRLNLNSLRRLEKNDKMIKEYAFSQMTNELAPSIKEKVFTPLKDRLNKALQPGQI